MLKILKRDMNHRSSSYFLCWSVVILLLLGAGCSSSTDPSDRDPNPSPEAETYRQVAVAHTGDEEVPFVAVHEDGSTVGLLGEEGFISGVVYQTQDGDSLDVRLGPEGLPNIVAIPGYLIVFRNYTDTTVDLGVIDLSEDDVSIHRGIELGDRALAALERQQSRIQLRKVQPNDNISASFLSDPEAFEFLELWELGRTLADVVVLVACVKVGASTAGGGLVGAQGAVCASALIGVLESLTAAVNPELENSLSAIRLLGGSGCVTVGDCIDSLVDAIQLNEEATDNVIEAAHPETVFTERRLGSLLASSEGAPSQLYLVEVAREGSDHLLGSMSIPAEPPFPITDMAICPSGEVFGISYTSLYRIHVGSQVDVVRVLRFDDVIPSPIPDNANALECQDQRLLVGAGQTLFEIKPETAIVTRIGSHDLSDFAGDLAIGPDSMLYATVRGTGENMLIRIDAQTGNAILVGPVGYDEIFGLGFIGGRLFGLTDASFAADGRLVELNVMTGAGTEVRRLGFAASGASPVVSTDSSALSSDEGMRR